MNGWRLTRGMRIMLAGVLTALAGFSISFWWYRAGYAVGIAGWLLFATGWVLHRLERRRELD